MSHPPAASHVAIPVAAVAAGARSDVSPTHGRPHRWSIVIAWLAPLATFALWALFVWDTLQRWQWADQSLRTRVWLATALVAGTLLSHTAGMYLFGRAGALVRMRAHRRVPRWVLNKAFRGDRSRMTLLVPSYAEEPRVVAATLWSAALQEFPDLRVVLLIDDSPHPTDLALRARLESTRALPDLIAGALEQPRAMCASALADLHASPGEQVARADVARLIETVEAVVDWLVVLGERHRPADHMDDFLVDRVFRGLADDFASLSAELRRALDADRLPAREQVLDSYHRLLRVFTAELSMFERKRYVSLSQEANKAMNLNSYISLMGAAWTVVATPEGDVLRTAASPGQADLVIPDADYVLTLDADSLLLPEYCVRLICELRRRGNEDVAVIQSPYCAVPGAGTRVERVAGATTDLQHLHHLGKTHFNATFWVGANAIIRRAALDDIVQVSTERGHPIRRYIQDRTVIEDTESSMDLAMRGWRLLNYPERLSYSATPADFGSLVVQRRRWANGGLIILPKTFGLVAGQRARGERVRVMEVALRTDYLTSIALTGLAVPTLMLVPTMRLLSPFLFLTALPFLLAQASDLRRLGHRAIDVGWVQALNLVLIPVNLAGVLKSLHQAATGHKIPFARTPKIADRVAAPATFVILPYLLSLTLALLGSLAFQKSHWAGFAFAAAASLIVLIGTIAFIGVRAAAVDVACALRLRDCRAAKAVVLAAPATSA